MANILGLRNFVRSDGTEKLLAAYANDIGVFNGAQVFLGQGRNLSGVKVEMDISLDYLIATNRSDANQVYNGTTWFDGGARTHMPKAKYVKTVGNKIYIADLAYVSTDFRSRVWFSDLPKNNDITWGYETGTNLAQKAGSKVVTSANSGFTTYGIKVGDPFFITTGANIGEYIVETIDSDQQLTLTEALKNTVSGSTFWVGSNWFDARTNDSDYIRGLGENDNKLMVFKRESLHRYDERELKRVKGVPGTTSHRSIVNIRENTFYFHDTGIYRYDGVTAFIISRAIQDWIDGIDSANFENIVAWRDGDLVYFFVGNIINSIRNINITNGLLIYDTSAQAWNIGSTNHVITVATEAIETNTRTTYLGTSTDEVLIWNSGNAELSAPIPWRAATVFHFPAKAYNVLEYDHAEFHLVNGRTINVYYKLYGTNKIDSDWEPLGELNNDVTDIPFPRGTFGRGIAFQFMELSTNDPPIISRIDIYYKDREARNLPNQTDQ